MRSADLVLFVDHVSNELDLACALKHVAWQRFGMEIAIESLKSNLSTTLDQWETRAIAVPSFSSRHDSGVQEILSRWTDVRIVNLDLSWRVGADDHDDLEQAIRLIRHRLAVRRMWREQQRVADRLGQLAGATPDPQLDAGAIDRAIAQFLADAESGEHRRRPVDAREELGVVVRADVAVGDPRARGPGPDAREQVADAGCGQTREHIAFLPYCGGFARLN